MTYTCRRLFFSSAFLFFSFHVTGQDFRKGYIIKNNGDSLSGFIAYRSMNKNYDHCSFKISKTKSATRYYPGDLKAYGFVDDKQYASIRLPSSHGKVRVFGKVLSRGVLMLYGYKDVFFIGKDSLILLPPPSGRLIDIEQKVSEEKGFEKVPASRRTGEQKFMRDRRYQGILNYFLEECQLSAINSPYTEYDLTNLINNYNRCKGFQPPAKAKKPIVKFNFQIFSGLTRSQLTTEFLSKNAFVPSTTYAVGGGVDVSSPAAFDRAFLSIEVWRLGFLYQGYNEGPYLGDVLHKDITMNLSYIKIPVGFRYNFREERNTPYFKVGFALSSMSKPKITTIEEREASSGTVSTTKYAGGYDVRSPRSVWISVGFDKTIVGTKRLFAEYRFERSNGFISTAASPFSHSIDHSFLIGLRF